MAKALSEASHGTRREGEKEAERESAGQALDDRQSPLGQGEGGGQEVPLSSFLQRLFRVNSPLRVPRIIVIDDDAEMRAMLEQTLKSAGHEVVLAANGKQGVKCYRANPTKLVITDLYMPEKEGLETIIELGREYPEVAIIAISGKPTASAL